MQKVRIAVVGGGGGIGKGSHLPAIAATSSAELAAVCDANEEGLRDATAQYGGAAYTDFDEMLKREDIDLVDIASPDFLHAEQAIAAAGAGKHVLCEKPMALSVADALAMKEAVEQSGVKFMVAQAQRWRPESLAFKQACQEIGVPAFTAYHVKGRFFPYPADSFYRKKESLGQFVHNGMHYVDFISWCIDSLPKTVYAMSTRHYPTDDRMQTDNYYIANVTYENGAIGVYELNQMMIEPAGFPAEVRWYVVGDEATAEWSSRSARQIELFSECGVSYPRAVSDAEHWEPFRGEISHMCECIIEDRAPCIPIDWSIRVLATCIGVVQSAETGEVIQLG